MKILLIKPPITYYKLEMDYSPYEPMGLMYLAAYLIEYGKCNVKILDASIRTDLKRWEGDFFKIGYADTMISAEIASFQPDIVGISSMFTINSKGVHDTAEIVKGIDKNILVIVGGAHASSFPDWVLKDENVDIVVKGEGEETFLEIVNRIRTKSDLSDVKGIVFRRDHQIVENPNRPFIKDLDTIPLPARDMVDMNAYLFEKYNYTHSMAPPRATVISSRGCPYRCTFCSIHSIWRHTYRMRVPAKVVDEIDHLVGEYGVREIAFFDDNLSVNRKRMLGICDEIIKRRLKIRWCTPNGIAIWLLDKEVLLRMRESGCYKLTFGIETASPNTQKFIKKDFIDLEKAKELIHFCNEIGIWTHSTFIIGFPYETIEDMMQTIHYAIDCGVDMASFFIATPYPGTELYDIYKSENLLPDMGDEKALEWLGNVGRSMTNTVNFTREQIEGYLSLAQRQFYLNRAVAFLNPLRITKKVRGIDEIQYVGRQMYSYSKRLMNSLVK